MRKTKMGRVRSQRPREEVMTGRARLGRRVRRGPESSLGAGTKSDAAGVV